MPSTFFGLNIGASALSTYQVAINTTNNNISNVQTEGYSRQDAIRETTDALRVNAKYGSCGTGVSAIEIRQERDLYYDDKFRNNNSKVGFYKQSIYYLDQYETIFQDDDIQQGFTAILSNMFSSLDTLKNNSEDRSVRNQFVNASQKLCTYFNNVSASMSGIQDDCNQEIKAAINDINAIGKKISMLNREINNIEVRGGHANELRDKRALLLDTLSSYVSVDTIEHYIANSNGENLGGTQFTVTVNGQVLVDGNDARQMKCVERAYKHNETDIEGLYDVVWSDTGMRFAAASTSSDGSLKALFQIRDGNGANNMKGNVTSVKAGDASSGGEITIKVDAALNDINRLDMAKSGEIMIESKYYHYDSWKATVDKNGNLESVTYILANEPGSTLSTDSANYMQGKADNGDFLRLECGSTVDFMGCAYYQEQMNEFLREFASRINDIEKKGVTLDGKDMGAFLVARTATDKVYSGEDWQQEFLTVEEDGTPKGVYKYPWELKEDPDRYTIDSEKDTYYQLTADNIQVNLEAIKDSGYFATSSKKIVDGKLTTETSMVDGKAANDLITDIMKLHSDVDFFRGTSGNKFLEVIISDVTVDTQKKGVFYDNYSNLNSTIDTLRMSISGVDEDEEALNLIKFQNAYNLASKVISVMSEMYNKLINETGVA